jgi:hypothetical protein
VAKLHQTDGMTEDLSDYFLRTTRARSVRAMAAKAGMEQTTLNRQLKGTISAETVVALCRAYDLDFADAFVAAGYITDEEANRLGARIGLAAFTDLELAREIVRRIENGDAGSALTGELPVEPSEPSPVVHLRRDVPAQGEDDDMLAAASESTRTRPDDRTDEGFL